MQLTSKNPLAVGAVHMPKVASPKLACSFIGLYVQPESGRQIHMTSFEESKFMSALLHLDLDHSPSQAKMRHTHVFMRHAFTLEDRKVCRTTQMLSCWQVELW